MTFLIVDASTQVNNNSVYNNMQTMIHIPVFLLSFVGIGKVEVTKPVHGIQRQKNKFLASSRGLWSDLAENFLGSHPSAKFCLNPLSIPTDILAKMSFVIILILP